MGFIEDLTPAEYELQSLRIERRDGGIVAVFALRLFSGTGNSIKIANYNVELNENERDVLVQFVTNKLSDLEAETGLVSTDRQRQP